MWKYIIVLITLAGCSTSVPENYPSIDKSFATFGEAWYWVVSNIEYKTDQEVHGKSEEWQTPEQTYYRKTGDCEDFAGLLGYFAKQMGVTCSVVRVQDSNGGHAVLKAYGMYHEPTHYGMYYSHSYVQKYQTNEWDIDTFIKLCYMKGLL